MVCFMCSLPLLPYNILVSTIYTANKILIKLDHVWLNLDGIEVRLMNPLGVVGAFVRGTFSSNECTAASFASLGVW